MLAPRGLVALVVSGLSPGLLLALLLASTLLLLLLAFALLLAFLALLLLAPATGEATDDALGLVCNPSYGVLSPLDGLPGLVGYLASGILCSSALLRFA